MNEFLKEVQSQMRADLIDQDPSQIMAFGRDWTRHYEPKSLGIAFPRSTQEVSQLLKLCSQYNIAVVPSGGRTGLSAGAVAKEGELVLSLSKMNQIHEVNTLSRTVRVQAGAVTEAVHQECEKVGLTWPIDFASKGSSCVGGNIATNAGGVKVIRYGLTRDWVLGLTAVLMDGTILELNGDLIKNNTGYDFRHLLIGSEGTLAVITEATLKLTELPQDLKVYFFALENFKKVMKLFEKAQDAPAKLMAFETLTHACLKNVLKLRQLPAPFQDESEVYVLMEVEKANEDKMQEWLAQVFEEQIVVDGTSAENSEQFKTLWAYREGVSESLSARGFVHKNDVALAVSQIEPFIQDFKQVFDQNYQGFEVFIFGHIGDGNLHLNILKPESLSKDEFLQKCHSVDQSLFSLIQKYKGSVSAEHGIGLVKKWALPYSKSEVEIHLMKEIKKAFDPLSLLNPGKIF